MYRWGLVALAIVTGCAEGVEAAAGPNELSAEERQEGWALLFDGESLDGWTPRGDSTWEIEDGSLVSVSGTGQRFLATDTTYDNFRLRVEFWVDEVANGGVFLRTPEVGEINQSNSLEVNIYDAHATWPTGSINEIALNESPNTVGQWNSFDVTADGDHLVVLLNGEPAVDTRIMRLPSGPIAIQHVGPGEIRYRSLRILPL